MIKDLIKPSEITAINKKLNTSGSITSKEATLLRESTLSESNIQIACHNIIKAKYPDSVIFVQIDNGGAMGVAQKKKKKAEGTQAGFCDVIILAWEEIIDIDLGYPWEFRSKQFFVEFKKIGGQPSKKQHYWYNFLRNKGESVHFCNNTIYFEQTICKEIDEFLNNKRLESE